VRDAAKRKFDRVNGRIDHRVAKIERLIIVSTMATTTLEDVALCLPPHLRWFQLYVFQDRTWTAELLKRVEAAGYRALVVTVDTPVSGLRENDTRNGFKLPPHLKLANLADRFQVIEKGSTSESPMTAFIARVYSPSLTWDDIQWLRSLTRLPIVVKGIMTPEDAMAAVEYGVSGIWVSNHGARQLDQIDGTGDVLSSIIQAVRRAESERRQHSTSSLTGSQNTSDSSQPHRNSDSNSRSDWQQHEVEVYVDGGLRRGTDIFKALAMGARAVFIGRPILWGLAYDGEDGVRQVLRLLRAELRNTMALAGCVRVRDITSQRVHSAPSLRSRL